MVRCQLRWPETWWFGNGRSWLAWRRKSPQPLRLVATRDIQRGEDLVFAYHKKGMPNSHMFNDYGFVPFLNKNEEVALFSSNIEGLVWIQEQEPFLKALQHRLSQLDNGGGSKAGLTSAHHNFSFSTRDIATVGELPAHEAKWMSFGVSDPPSPKGDDVKLHERSVVRQQSPIVD
ncbi:hypothetical protein WJX73_005672 [Symbiochloris irregularis]|uniref:SET domain-containing protein n=1 Tax=Symbiochloris irregularis TaxID=706552 RepID=A0AAW1PFR0_9CHLO